MRTRTAFFSSLLAASAFTALAQGTGDHPAAGTAHALDGVAPAASLAAQPASPAWQARHANHEHPAIAMRREAGRLDPNTFIVQPPAHVEWASAGAAALQGPLAATPVR